MPATKSFWAWIYVHQYEFPLSYSRHSCNLHLTGTEIPKLLRLVAIRANVWRSQRSSNPRLTWDQIQQLPLSPAQPATVWSQKITQRCGIHFTSLICCNNFNNVSAHNLRYWRNWCRRRCRNWCRTSCRSWCRSRRFATFEAKPHVKMRTITNKQSDHLMQIQWISLQYYSTAWKKPRLLKYPCKRLDMVKKW